MERIFAVDIKDIFAPAQAGLVDIKTVVNIIVKNAFTIAGIITFVLLIFSGFQFIVAAGSGDTKKLESAKKAITSAVVGLIVIFTSYWIVQIVEILTGLSLI